MLGIVIVNYLDYARTERFIREELSRISCPYRVVVVDNGNDASGAETLRQHTGCQVLVLENNGFAAGCNAGAAALCEDPEVDVILFSNNDIHLQTDDVVDRLMLKLRERPDIGVIGPEIIGTDATWQVTRESAPPPT